MKIGRVIINRINSIKNIKNICPDAIKVAPVYSTQLKVQTKEKKNVHNLYIFLKEVT